jgi:hypothetical protein
MGDRTIPDVPSKTLDPQTRKQVEALLNDVRNQFIAFCLGKITAETLGDFVGERAVMYRKLVGLPT